MDRIYMTREQLLTLILSVFSGILVAQSIPFNCDYNAYLFQYNDVYAIDLASGNAVEVATDITEGSVNATGYNPADGFIWGSLSAPEKSIVRIGKNFTTTTYYIPELPSNGRYIGDVSSTGMYYLKGGGITYYKINIDPNSDNYAQHDATETLSQNISIHDWAFNAVDGQLYAVEKSTNILYRIDPSNGQVNALGEVPVLAGNNYTYGAVYFDADGRFYVSANQTGTVYVIQAVQNISSAADMDSNLFAFGPSSSSNDGARCPTAPVAQEICDNGIDDDGDGLIDCEDPSCSGFGECAVIEPPTSGGNNSGLESNNRLSEQINQRNFNRAKTGYIFDRNRAPRIKKSYRYAKRMAKTSIMLQDFIPLGVIGENATLNSTPTDLLGITNASDIFAVDYMSNSNSVASVLALKTENGVYEHTKYICDRLLGAELISVSTMHINEQPFIKSIIKNLDGTYEFVLSLSAKAINNDQNFAIESHWNLDQYEENVTFYNFQIWSNTVDDLYLLGAEVLNLLEIQKPISQYDLSTPPTVFVRKGKYTNGGLDLQIVNTNATESIMIDAGFRTTETTDFSTYNSSIELGGQYITDLTLDIGHLFDIGFRIGYGIGTPDDLFMSDGPWGIDDSQAGTEVTEYEITANDFNYEATDYPIERNVALSAETNTYVAAYRALTPRFKAVDLTNYNSLKLSAQGTGNLEITFVKESLTNWEDQYKTTIALTNSMQDYVLPLADFMTANDIDPVLDDVVTIVFTMVSEDGTTTSKVMDLNNLRLSQDSTLSVDEFEDEFQTLRAYPNPMRSQTTIDFTLPQTETIAFIIYDQLGKQVYHSYHKAEVGKNRIIFTKGSLSSGLYFCKIVSIQYDIKPLKLIIN